MAQQLINLGTDANDGTGDSPRTGGEKINENFTELYSIQSQTVNAGSYIGATDEAKINAAIIDAALSGAARVFVPASMYPYNSSLVTFNQTVLMVREGGDFSVCDAWAYGAAGDGVTNDTVALQQTVLAASYQVLRGSYTATPFPTAYLPGGVYLVTAPIILKSNVCLRGSGMGTVISVTDGWSGTAVILNDVSGFPATYQQMAFIDNLQIIGNGVAGSNGVYWDTLGQISHIRDVVISTMAGYGITIDASSLGGVGVDSVGIRLDNVWVIEPGDHCLKLLRCRGIHVTNFHGELMPAGKASIYINGLDLSNAGRHHIDGVHHESAAHSGYMVYVTTSQLSTIKNVWSTRADSTDTAVYMAADTFGNILENIQYGDNAGGLCINDLNGNFPRTVADAYVALYVQSATGTTSQGDGRIFGLSFASNLNYIAGNYTAKTYDENLLVDATGASRTITLPAASGQCGRTYRVKKFDASVNTVIIDGNASETIDGATTLTLTTQNQCVTIICDGSNWYKFAN